MAVTLSAHTLWVQLSVYNVGACRHSELARDMLGYLARKPVMIVVMRNSTGGCKDRECPRQYKYLEQHEGHWDTNPNAQLCHHYAPMVGVFACRPAKHPNQAFTDPIAQLVVCSGQEDQSPKAGLL